MSFLNSVFYGTQGVYKINGIEIKFTNDTPDIDVFGNTWFGRSVNLLQGNSAFRFLTFGYLHVLIHEMGHAMVAKMQGQNPIITVYTKTCRGTNHGGSGTLSSLAGPLAGVALESIKFIGATALASFIPAPIGISIGIFIGAGAAIWTFGELMYAFTASNGDWEHIAQNGVLHLVASWSVLLSTILLGYLSCYAIAYSSLPISLAHYLPVPFQSYCRF